MSKIWPDEVWPGYIERGLPDDQEPLKVGDRLELTFDMYQGGEWFIAMQIWEIERRFAADGRLKLHNYLHDKEAMTMTFDVEVLSNPTGQSDVPSLASSAGVIVTVLVTLALVTAILCEARWGWLYKATRRGRVRRKATPTQQRVLDDPNTPEDVKEAIREGIDRKSDISDTVSIALWAVVLFAGLALWRKVFK